MNRYPILSIIAGFCLLTFTTLTTTAQRTSQLDVPRTISYQGLLTSNEGTALPDGAYDITVTLYSDPGGIQPLWNATYKTTTHNGVFNLYLGGDNTPLPDPQQMNRPLWVGTSVNGSQEMLPLTPLTASPYALNLPDNAITTGKLADGAVTAEKVEMDYVKGFRVNGQEVTGKGALLNIEGSKDIALSFNEETNTLQFSKALPATERDNEKGASTQHRSGTNTGSEFLWSLSGDGWQDNGAGVQADNSDWIGTSENFNFTIQVYNAGAATGGNKRVMQYQPNSTSANILGGHNSNSISNGVGNIIAGGGENSKPNTILSSGFGVIGGGEENTMSYTQLSVIGGGYMNSTDEALYAFIGGGYDNDIAYSTASTIGGGTNNSIDFDGSYCVIGGGEENSSTNSSHHTVIGGGKQNRVERHLGTVSGGLSNVSSGYAGTIGGGEENVLYSVYTTIGGGWKNNILLPSADITGCFGSAILGGTFNIISNKYSFIGGGIHNSIYGYGSVVSGGSGNTIVGNVGIIDPSSTSSYNSIGGGLTNIIGANEDPASYSFVGGGRNNVIYADYAAITGGNANIIEDGVSSAVIGGGANNKITVSTHTDVSSSVIAGGRYNTIGANTGLSTIGGGSGNNITANGSIGNPNFLHATIPGGDNLTAQSWAQTVVGGYNIPKGSVAPRAGAGANRNNPIFIVGAGYDNGAGGMTNFNAFEVSYNGHSIVYDENGTGGYAGLPGRGVVEGGTYTDNPIYGWANVDMNGQLMGGCGDFGVEKIEHQSPGVYRITLNIVQSDGVSPAYIDCGAVVATLGSATNPPLPPNLPSSMPMVAGPCAQIYTTNILNNVFEVYITTIGSNCHTGFDLPFKFHVTGRVSESVTTPK